MPISENQLQTWSHQGAITSSKQTVASIEHALNSYAWPDGIRKEIYLQGSYKNDTNIRGDSDVDIVVQLNSSLHSNLSEVQKRLLGMFPATYTWAKFRNDVMQALTNYYGRSAIIEGNKALKVSASSLPLSADVVVSIEYRNYFDVVNNRYISGMSFEAIRENRWVINYPKVHYAYGVQKHQATANRYRGL